MVRLLRKKGQPIFILMIFLTLLISVPFQPALAALIETETVINPDRVRDTRVLLNQLMAREDVRMALLSYGINPVEVDARVAAMTDDEITTVANTMKDMPSGGEGWETLALVVLGVVIVASLLFLLLISAGVYAGIKIAEQNEQKEREYSKSTPYPAPARVGPVPSVNPDEPWTGAWKVVDGQDSRVYVLKQIGNSVVSTSESDYSVEAKVYGAMIVGAWYSTGSSIRHNFKAIIADDFLSFKGDINSQTFFTCQKIESKSAAVAAVNVKPSEPWTGKWKVSQGRLPGIWSLAQNGDTVISTADSDFKLEAKVYGTTLRGKWSTKGVPERDIQATIAEDGLSFSGATDYTALRDYFTAKKIE